ncbi:MAG: hypothetical protein HQK51_19115, partial [Oligoflexia bacterium]|nr:hypothetical protein [Oligoflexia bacterium]
SYLVIKKEMHQKELDLSREKEDLQRRLEQETDETKRTQLQQRLSYIKLILQNIADSELEHENKLLELKRKFYQLQDQIDIERDKVKKEELLAQRETTLKQLQAYNLSEQQIMQAYEEQKFLNEQNLLLRMATIKDENKRLNEKRSKEENDFAKKAEEETQKKMFEKLELIRRMNFLTEEERSRFTAEDLKSIKETFKTKEDIEKQSLLDSRKQKIESDNRFLADSKQFAKAYAEINRVTNSEVYQGTKSAMGQLSELTQSNNSKLKAIGKVASIASIIISTQEAMMNIYRGFSAIPIVGHALGIAGAAATAAWGAERISRVNAAKAGAFVTTGIEGKDTVPFMLSKYELVVPSKSYDEHINAVVNQRLNRSSLENNFVTKVSEKQRVDIRLSMGEKASKILAAQILEDRNLGLVEDVF